MNSVLILYPAFGMFAFTLACIFYLGFSRYQSIQKRNVKISFFRTYDEGSQPKRLHLIARHVQNHFEVPPLFYVGVILAYVTGKGGEAALLFAWLFLGARIVHAYIHLGRNNVSVRFFTFGSSLMCLLGLWASVFIDLVLSTS